MKKILVVDNERVILEFMKELLSEEGHKVVLAKNGLEALDILKTFKPDIMFVDLVMPKIDGKKLCKIVRRMKELKDIILVILSGAVVEKEPDLHELEVNACIAKSPFNRMSRHVLDIVNRHDLSASQLLYDGVIGAKGLYSRGITKELLTSESDIRVVLESMSEGVLELTSEGRIIYANPSAVSLLNKEEEKLLGSYYSELFRGDDGRRKDELFTELKKGHKVIRDEIPIIVNNRYLIANMIPVDSESCSAIIMLKDVTEQKESETALQRQFFQAQKMEAIGVLAGGVAHDFNNLLTTIIGNSELALMDNIEDELLKEELEEIKQAGEKAAALTRQLLAFSRQQIIKPRVYDLNEGLRDLEKMLRRLIGEDIELSIHREAELWMTYADPAQIDQVIMNLVVNAREAMPKGGNLTIETANVDLDGDFFRRMAKEKKPGPYVMLSISDNGPGMDEETRSRIFDPFFTTKGMARGTGLGLSAVYGIITQSGGFIDVLSTPGQGSTFIIYLPRAESDEEVKRKGSSYEEGNSGSETILIVEDDDTLRNYGMRVLKRYGYRVLDAQNAEDALKKAENHMGPIHLMVTDLVMPRIDGCELAERLKTFRPETSVLLMSGYADDSISHHEALDSGLAFLDKPFTPESLARKVREVLDGKVEN